MTSAHLDRFNPQAEGWDRAAPDFIAAQLEAAADPMLLPYWDRELKAETVRFQAWATDALRPTFSAMGPDPYTPRTPALMLAKAKLLLAEYLAWRASDDGQLYALMIQVRKMAEGIKDKTFRLEDARSRGDGSLIMEAGELTIAGSQINSAINNLDALCLKVEQDRQKGGKPRG